MARSIPALASAPGKTLTIPRSSTSAGGRASAINRSLRGRRRSVDPVNEPAGAGDVLQTHHLAGGEGKSALPALVRPFEGLEAAPGRVPPARLDHLLGREGNSVVTRGRHTQAPPA